MAVRAGMANLILELRSMVNAGTADYSVSGVSYWTDQQLQDRLDRFRVDLNRAPLRYDSEYVGGTAYYHDYYAPLGNLEEAGSGTIHWQVEDGDGNAAGTATYAADYIAGLIRFTNDQGGSAYYLRGRSYNLKRAASSIWREKAGSVAAYYSFSADGQSFSRSHWFEHCLSMADNYEADSGIQTTRLIRNDLT